MPSETQLAYHILQRLDIAVFKRTGPWQYVLFGIPPAFFAEQFCLEQGAETVDFWQNSDMLEFFLHDVELFFEHEQPGSITSGIWHEAAPNGQEVSLVANAMVVDGAELVIVRTLGEEYEEKIRILQKARENLLERRRLSVDLNEYKQRSRRDGLTGLFNRSTFDELLKENMNLSERTGASLSLIMIDIDNFKQVNDTLGHLVGDSVLTGLGQLLQNILRREDVACRYGGEEFTIIAPYTTRHQIRAAAEKIRAEVEAHTFPNVPVLTISVGCSTYQPDETAENFIHRADLALYDAKNAGKNRVCVR